MLNFIIHLWAATEEGVEEEEEEGRAFRSRGKHVAVSLSSIGTSVKWPTGEECSERKVNLQNLVGR